MKIPVTGFDPSLTHWGIAEGQLDLVTGELTEVLLTLIEPVKETKKQVRQNSIDLSVSEQLATIAIKAAQSAKVVFVEPPVGSQSARAMASYGVCMGILGSLRALGVPLIEVTATEVKLAFTSLKNASKPQMVRAGVGLYPDLDWPRYTQNGKGYKKGEIMPKAEHVADAIAAIHAGVNTPLFQQLMRLYITPEPSPNTPMARRQGNGGQHHADQSHPS